jgi:hypothetical protein
MPRQPGRYKRIVDRALRGDTQAYGRTDPHRQNLPRRRRATRALQGSTERDRVGLQQGRVCHSRCRRGAEDAEARGRPLDVRRRCPRGRADGRRRAGVDLHRPVRLWRLSSGRLWRLPRRRFSRRLWRGRSRLCRGPRRLWPRRRRRRVAPALRLSRRMVWRRSRRGSGSRSCGGRRGAASAYYNPYYAPACGYYPYPPCY